LVFRALESFHNFDLWDKLPWPSKQTVFNVNEEGDNTNKTSHPFLKNYVARVTYKNVTNCTMTLLKHVEHCTPYMDSYIKERMAIHKFKDSCRIIDMCYVSKFVLVESESII
jgi:hypothetical protein